MLLEINIKEVWKPKNLSYIDNKLKVMVLLITYYLLAGTIIGFGIEHVIKWSGQDLTGLERAQMIALWPITSLVFAFYFIKGLLGND